MPNFENRWNFLHVFIFLHETSGISVQTLEPAYFEEISTEYCDVCVVWLSFVFEWLVSITLSSGG